MRIIADRNIRFAREVFSLYGEVTLLDKGEWTSNAVREAEVLIIRSDIRVDDALLAGSRVRFVGSLTAGLDHVDQSATQARGIVLEHAPGCNAASVAEYCLAALLTWSAKANVPLRGRTIGVVGVGNIGSRVARLAGILGMNVLLNDPPKVGAYGLKGYSTLDELMASDIVTLHVPLTTWGDDPTYRLFNASRLARMKRGSVLINTSRGSIVETGALGDAMRSGHLSAVVADVWEKEPDIDLDLLEKTAIGTAHIAGYSMDAKVAALRRIQKALADFAGIQAAWPTDLISESNTVISVPENLTSPEQVIRHLVRLAYDIEEDDRLLRVIRTVPPPERQKYFSGLRRSYRTRWEFPHFAVDGATMSDDLVETIGSLGFKVNFAAQNGPR
jgi:erythronate-4-phosphate dehydrogenase